MKIKNLIYTLVVVVVCILTSCEYDNYDAPSYEFSGILKTADGSNFSYDSNRTLFQFFQSGYGKVDVGTNMNVTDNGTFQQLLFKDDYKLTLVNHNLPFEIDEFPSLSTGFDTIPYHITKHVQETFTVRPYYTIENLTVALEGKRINATFDVVKNHDTQKEAPRLIRAYIYLGTTIHVNSGTSCQRLQQIKATVMPDTQTLTIGIPLSYYRDKTYYVNNYRDYAFVRVGLLLDGVPDYVLVSEIVKITDLPYSVN
jgi:hypothetical protein